MIEVVLYALACGFALSALLVPLTALAIRRGTELSAATRHMLWFVVLIATVAAPFAAFAVSALRPADRLPAAIVPAAARVPDAIQAAGALPSLCLVLLAGWLIVSSARLVLIARGIGASRLMKRRGAPLDCPCDVPRGARVLAAAVAVPSAVGYLHPAILLPAGTIPGLDPSDARRIVLHEAAHLRRRDDLTGIVFLVSAALFWFNPFVHAIGKKLALECEIACDDIVVEQTGDPKRYAALLLEVAQSVVGQGPQLAWSGFVHPSGLVVRIRSLVRRPGARQSALPRPALAALIGMLLAAIGLAAFHAPALGRGAPAASADDTSLSSQRVRDFRVCTAGEDTNRHNGTRVHDGLARCEDPTMVGTSLATRVVKEH